MSKWSKWQKVMPFNICPKYYLILDYFSKNNPEELEKVAQIVKNSPNLVTLAAMILLYVRNCYKMTWTTLPTNQITIVLFYVTKLTGIDWATLKNKLEVK